MLRRILAVTAAAVVALLAAEVVAGETSLPKAYRSWAHVKSMVITDKGHSLYGFHNVYANPQALEAMRKGSAYPKGSELVVSFYEVASDGPMLSQGKKIMDAYMKKDASAKDTGGWAFGVFGPDGKPLQMDVVKGCYDCHAGGAKGTDLVFSKFIE
jgi:Cytochrome P460